MTNPQKKKKKKQALATWQELKEKILSKFNYLKKNHQIDLKIILSELLASDKKQLFALSDDEEFSLTDIMVGINRLKERIAALEQENWQLKGLGGSGDDDPTIEEVD